MLDVLRELNRDKDRCMLIGRNALNFLLENDFQNDMLFRTTDYDLVCPDFKTAQECRQILNNAEFQEESATFRSSKGELDILLADPEYPQSVIERYYNVPSLRPLWNARERQDGVLVPDPDKLIMNKLLYARDNEGKDNETIALYFGLRPERFDTILKTITEHYVPEERDRMLFSLYESVAEVSEEQKIKVETILLSDVETLNTSPQQQRSLLNSLKNARDR
jgi:hypothetical protein